jgi:hypothetical protein
LIDAAAVDHRVKAIPEASMDTRKLLHALAPYVVILFSLLLLLAGTVRSAEGASLSLDERFIPATAVLARLQSSR